jgi:hypothetical protein
MRPGARVVSNTFDMGDWRPDQRRTIGGTNIFMWFVPARSRAAGASPRGGGSAELVLTQNYQDISGTAGGNPIAEAQLRGDRIAFTADLGQGRSASRAGGGRAACAAMAGKRCGSADPEVPVVIAGLILSGPGDAAVRRHGNRPRAADPVQRRRHAAAGAGGGDLAAGTQPIPLMVLALAGAPLLLRSDWRGGCSCSAWRCWAGCWWRGSRR